MSTALELTSQCNRNYVPVLSQPQLVYVLTELQPGAAMASVRLPLNFALILDRSGSMLGEKLRTVKEAVKTIIDRLSPNDVISVITFEDRTQVLIPAQGVTERDSLKRLVDGIRTGGATSMAPALREGLTQVGRYHTPDRISRMVLLTDGEATDSEDASRRQADQAGQRGIPIIGLGFGKDWKKEDFMIDLANRSMLAQPGGQFGVVHYIQRPEQAASIFQEVYQSMQVVAKEVNLTIRMVQGIEARRVWQVVPMIKDVGLSAIQGRAVLVPVGDLDKGGAAFLVEMMLPPRPAGNVRIAQTEVTYSLPPSAFFRRGEPEGGAAGGAPVQNTGGGGPGGGGGPQREAIDLVVSFTQDAALASQVNGHVMNIVERVTAFKLQTQALDEAQMGNVKGATQKLRQAVTILLAQGETELAKQMETEAANLEQSGQISAEGKKTIKLTSRKTVKLSE